MSDSEKTKSSWWDCMKTIEHKWHAPIVSIEWVCWRISPFLRQLSFLEVLEYLSRLAILVAVIFYIWGCEDRQKAKHYQAWQVINSAQGKPGSGGRMDALQDLNRDDVSLAGVDISNATLRGINLEHANLREANFSRAHLYEANLSMAYLYFAKMSRVFLENADLSGADLSHADLNRAALSQADLSGAVLFYADLSDAGLVGANLAEANLYGADISKITGWQSIKSIRYANIYGVKSPPNGFEEWATEHGAISIEDPNDWKKLIREKMQEKTKEK
jgi:hypothetical protein